MRVWDLLSRLGRVRKTTERSWQATCPAHPAETPSQSWNVTAQTLNRGLVKKKIVIPGPENRAETKRRFNGDWFRFLMIPLSVPRDQPPPPAAPDSAPAGPAANGPGAAGNAQTTWLNRSFHQAAPVALAAPNTTVVSEEV